MEKREIDGLELGTPEAAVRSCVNLFARLFETPEEYVACYLDMYYQLRRSMEEADCHTSAAALARNDDPPTGCAGAPFNKGSQGEDGTPRAQAPTEKGRSAPWVKYKRGVIARIQAARARGVTYARIAQAGGERVTEGLVCNALNAVALKQKEWLALGAAMDKIEAEDAG